MAVFLLYTYKEKQISHITEEYNDAVQRAARLSVAGESFLTGKKDPVNVMTQEDLVVYTQWLVCHLHSLKGIHSFLQVSWAFFEQWSIIMKQSSLG